MIENIFKECCDTHNGDYVVLFSLTANKKPMANSVIMANKMK